MSAHRGTADTVREVACDRRERSAFDDEDLCLLGTKLAAGPTATRRTDNRAFAERFIGEHRETLDRLAE